MYLINVINITVQEGETGSSLQTLLDETEFLPQCSVTTTSTAIKADLDVDSIESSSDQQTRRTLVLSSTIW